MGVIIPQRYEKQGVDLSLEKILKLTPNGCHDALALRELGISWHPAHRDHVLTELKKFIMCVKSRNFYAESSVCWSEIQLDLDGVCFPMKVAPC